MENEKKINVYLIMAIIHPNRNEGIFGYKPAFVVEPKHILAETYNDAMEECWMLLDEKGVDRSDSRIEVVANLLDIISRRNSCGSNFGAPITIGADEKQGYLPDNNWNQFAAMEKTIDHVTGITATVPNGNNNLL